MSESSSSIDAIVDETNLGGDNGEVYIFQWLAANEKALQQASADDLKESQKPLVDALLKVITAPEPYPSPGRPIRQLVAQCFAQIYTKGDTRSLFDTVQALLKIPLDPKLVSKDGYRVAALYCIGELMKNFGSQIMSLMVETTTACLRLSRSSNANIVRYHAVVTLEKAISTAKRALTDSLQRDVIKQMRSALSDKSLPVIRATTGVLILLFPFGDSAKALPDVEQLVVICTKQLDSADQPTRIALAKLVAFVLASTQTDHVVLLPEPYKKSKKGESLSQAEDDEPTPPSQEVKRLLTPQEMLSQLATQFNKPNASRRIRIGIFDFYAALFKELGTAFVEANYALVVSHLMTEIVSHVRNTGARYDIVLVRTLVGLILRDLVGVRMLGEQAQISAIQELSKAYLKRWPAMMPGQTAPSPLVLTIALREVAGLLQQLGNAPVPVQDALVDPLTTLLTHPVHTVRVTAAWTLRRFCYSTPLRLPKVLLNLVELLQNDLAALITPAAPSDINNRVIGRAYGLAGLLSLIPQRPLYVSYDISASAFYIAVQLLKRAGEHDVKIAKVEIEVAWTLIASLMTLGPNFVRAHLPQLLVLWRNALPKPTTKDGLSGRNAGEWIFLLAVRENALRAIYCFLTHNSPILVTADVARRVTSLLTNALQFSAMFSSQRVVEEPQDSIPPPGGRGLSLVGMDALFKCRIFQCFSALGVSKVTESTQSSLLQSAITLFASLDGYSGSSVQAAIATSSGSFTSVWQSTDCYAYGVTDIEIKEDLSGKIVEGTSDWLNRDLIDASLDSMHNKPILRSWEYDPMILCLAQQPNTVGDEADTSPASTAAVNEAIRIFAELLPLQDLSSMTKTVNQLVEATASAKADKNSGRKAAVLVNSAVALVLALRRAATHPRQLAETLGHPQVSGPLAELLKAVLVDGDVLLRKAGSEAIGRLASLAGTNFLTSQIKTLVNEVVSNRDPYGRAGCALAFGSIYNYVGGLAAGPLLKTTVHVLMSLVNDPHPVVNFWALRALAQVIDAASLAYASYVPSTLGLLLRSYMLESHEPEGGTLNYVNMSGELPLYQALCQAIDAIITVVGPDIQESAKTRSLVLDLVHQFIREDDDGICVEAIRCVQHLLIFTPEHIDVPILVTQFRGYLGSTRRPLKLASINALYQLVQKDVMTISRLGGDQLVEELFAMLDDDSSVAGVRNVITSWLQQTVVFNPSAWIDLCQRIMSRTTASQQAGDAASKRNDLDDEGQSLSVDPSADGAGHGPTRSTARWRTQLYALQCLHEICVTVARSSRREHLDIAFAKAQGIALPRLLISRISDLIKIAFTASAAHVMEIRLEGLTVLRDVIEIFASSPDPDFEGALLLEQYQAPITAALTPAFAADSTPEILASAIKSCAVFVGSGVVKDVSRMGRILKLLTSALEQCQESSLLRLGDAIDLGPNASVMLRIAILSAWAELQIASRSQQYLVDIVQPYNKVLATQWIGSLRDYASIRAGTELLDDTSAGAVDSSHASLGKEVLLPYYRDAWSVILQAVTCAMEDGDPFIRVAMDGREPSDADASEKVNGSTEHPTTFFFVIFGLVFEALVTSSPDSGRQNVKNTVTALKALKCLVQNKYAGNAFRDVAIFEELVNLCYRMALTEPVTVQISLVETLASLAENVKTQSFSDGSSPPQTHCLRICAYILKRAINPRENMTQDSSTPLDRMRLINAGFDAFSTIATTCEAARGLDYCTVAVSLYNELLEDEISEVDLVGPTLQSLKKLLDSAPSSSSEKVKFEKIVHGILSACLVNIDAMRGREGPACRKKIKSNVLAAVLILTVLPPNVKISQPVIEHCCFSISQRLIDSDEMSITAAHCAKTLIIASIHGSPSLRQCAKLLLPGMIECIVKISATGPGETSEMQSQIVGEIFKAFTTLFTSTGEEQRPRLLGVLLPVMTLVLNPSRTPTPPLHTQTISQVLQFAASSPAAFKEVTGKLPNDMKEVLETSVRQALGGSKVNSTESHKPQISLRSF
ncbi:clathrin-coated vesicle protein [Cytidiella melzeri]|nr:clathrin-coated vesicle protein [Cytidiella melzeri]